MLYLSIFFLFVALATSTYYILLLFQIVILMQKKDKGSFQYLDNPGLIEIFAGHLGPLDLLSPFRPFHESRQKFYKFLVENENNNLYEERIKKLLIFRDIVNFEYLLIIILLVILLKISNS